MGDTFVSVLAFQARAAAKALSGIDGASISLGCSLQPQVVEQLAAELPGRCERTVLVDCSPAHVSVAMHATICGVYVIAQGRRPVQASDAALSGWSDAEHRRATEDEVRVAVEAADDSRGRTDPRMQ